MSLLNEVPSSGQLLKSQSVSCDQVFKCPSSAQVPFKFPSSKVPQVLKYPSPQVLQIDQVP